MKLEVQFAVTKNMKELLFKKDFWFLDFVTILCFALCASVFTQIAADSGERYPEKILIALFYGFSSYTIAFILAICFRAKINWMRSWVWFGIIGSLIRILIIEVSALNSLWMYHQKFSASLVEALGKTVADVLIGTLVNWVLWAVIGLTFIFAVRLILYIFTVNHKFFHRKLK